MLAYVEFVSLNFSFISMILEMFILLGQKFDSLLCVMPPGTFGGLMLNAWLPSICNGKLYGPFSHDHLVPSFYDY